MRSYNPSNNRLVVDLPIWSKLKYVNKIGSFVQAFIAPEDESE